MTTGQKSHVKSINLSWIVVKNLDEAVKYYQEKVGLQLFEKSAEFGWAEMGGQDSNTRLGIAQEQENSPWKAGTNAIMTLTVDNIEESRKQLQEKGATLQGDVMEVPGMVKLQSFTDPDGNHMQLVEVLEEHVQH